MNDTSSSHDTGPPPAMENRSPRRRAVVISLVVHGVIAVVLLFTYLPNREPTESQPTAASLPSASDNAASGSQSPTPPVIAPAEVTDVPREQIEKSLETQIEQYSKLSDEQKLSELEKNLQRLESVSNTESVQDVTATIASTIGLDPNQYDPDKSSDEGAFDVDTAQLHDVTRKQTEAGSWQYESVLVDSAGRKMTVPMGEAEGETVYSTFQQMKKYPLAEVIYRGVVMPLIQKMIGPEQATQQAPLQDSPTQDAESSTNETSGIGGGKL